MVNRSLIGLAVLVLCAAPRVQANEEVALFTDAQMTSCSVTESFPGVVVLHLFHVGSGCRRGVEFKAPIPACWAGATWLGDNIVSPFLTIGSTQGPWLAIAYTENRALPVYLGTITIMTAGTGGGCCEYPVLNSDAYPPKVVATVDCANNLLFTSGGKAVINADASCPCGQHPTPVESTTWGRVKSLYH
jgi:hypothetical protein